MVFVKNVKKIGGLIKMSMIKETYLQFIEDNKEDLLNKFISKKNIEGEWELFIMEQFEAYESDLADQRVVSTNSGDRLARRLKAYFFETSALSGENVEKAFTSLSRMVLSKALTSAKKETSFTI